MQCGNKCNRENKADGQAFGGAQLNFHVFSDHVLCDVADGFVESADYSRVPWNRGDGVFAAKPVQHHRCNATGHAQEANSQRLAAD